ncbi:N-acetylmuramoyl-L-alanine amidase family protein [Rubritalea sp.]|uniref:N-acetylmuramoyl-L-alanine amidase family protein n=1 Tax=Rubritalea sp. TaxID=2109375 RepID=UPI003EF48230
MKLDEILIVLDPGHGGKDPGAVGKLGLRESDVVLSVCLILAENLRSYGVPVKLTREVDEFLSLAERCDLANSAKATLFLSVHCNASTTGATGIETFHMLGSVKGAEFAGCLQDSLLDEFTESNDRGVKQESYYVLRKTKMAAALAELEFIDVAEKEELFSQSHVLAAYADALLDGILAMLGIAKRVPLIAKGLPTLPSGREKRCSERRKLVIKGLVAVAGNLEAEAKAMRKLTEEVLTWEEEAGE